MKNEDMKASINFNDDDDGSDIGNGLLEGYENDNVDFGLLLSSDDEHSFSTMSHILKGQMFKDGTDPVELRIGMVLRNMKFFAWALQNFYIQ